MSASVKDQEALVSVSDREFEKPTGGTNVLLFAETVFLGNASNDEAIFLRTRVSHQDVTGA
jgi:hypothetical protein